MTAFWESKKVIVRVSGLQSDNFLMHLCTLIGGILKVDDDAQLALNPSIRVGRDSIYISPLTYKGFVLACNNTSGSSIWAVRMPTFPGPCEVKGEASSYKG